MTGAIDALTDGMAFGFGDELTAAEAGLLGRTPNGGWYDYSKSFGDRYDDALQAECEQNARFYKDNPVIANAANIAGAVAVPFGAALIFSSAEYCLRVARRMSLTTFSPGLRRVPDPCLISNPWWLRWARNPLLSNLSNRPNLAH